MVKDNIHKKGAFEKLSLAGRPPVGLGVTSGGNFYGNTQLTFTDVMGDKQISFYAQQVNQYRTTAFTYLNSERRHPVRAAGLHAGHVLLRHTTRRLYDPSSRRTSTATTPMAVAEPAGAPRTGSTRSTATHGSRSSAATCTCRRTTTTRSCSGTPTMFQLDQFGNPVFRSGHMMPVGVAFVQETTVFREYGPVAGNTMRLAYDVVAGSAATGSQRQTLDVDARHYTRLVANGVLALRFRGFKSWGRNPDFMYFGGNSEMRGYDYLEFLGHKGFFANAELRFPLIEAMLTPIGVLGGLRGVLFINIGSTGFNNMDTTVHGAQASSPTGRSSATASSTSSARSSRCSARSWPSAACASSTAAPPTASASRARCSASRCTSTGPGRRCSTAAGKTPASPSDAWFEDPSGNTLGSDWFRKMRFQFWIGYDW